jgi:hypothetical protein
LFINFFGDFHMGAVSGVSPNPPLQPANANGLGGGCATTRDKNGNAVFDSKNYTITVTSGSVVTVHNKNTGETYRVWGDPHVQVDGVQAFDFKETMTIVLNDGTKVTIDTAPWGNSGATVASRVTITNPDAHYGVQIYGASLVDNQDISFSETLQYGQQLDAGTADNVVIWENGEGSGFRRFDPKTGQFVAVTQATINSDEQASAGGMFDPNATAANNSSWLNGSAPRFNTSQGNNMTSVSANSYVNTMGASFLKELNGGAGGTKADISKLFGADHLKDGVYTYKLAGGGEVKFSQPLGPGEDVVMTVTAGGVTMSVEFESQNGGPYTVSKPYISAPGVPASTLAWLNNNMAGAGSESMINLLDLIKQTGEIKKKGQGAIGGEEGGDYGGASWFIQLAEALGTILNQIADKLKKLVDDADLGENGQPPFKEGMVIQGMAQQLSFISQALMTALNSLGDAIKSTVTAGGAAR